MLETRLQRRAHQQRCPENGLPLRWGISIHGAPTITFIDIISCTTPIFYAVAACGHLQHHRPQQLRHVCSLAARVLWHRHEHLC